MCRTDYLDTPKSKTFNCLYKNAKQIPVQYLYG